MVSPLTTIQRFLDASRQPALFEPGGEPIRLLDGNFSLDALGTGVLLHAWDDRRSLSRRIVRISEECPGRLVVEVERFGKKRSALTICDLARPGNAVRGPKAARHDFREFFRRLLRREFPAYSLDELSADPDLEHSLSPSYPRALMRIGGAAWAVIAAPPGAGHAEGVLTFGLIWLDYLRRRERKASIRGLILFLPEGAEKTSCLRIRYLNPALAQYRLFSYTADGAARELDLRDAGNIETKLETARAPTLPAGARHLLPLLENPAVEAIDPGDGTVRLRVRGLEFARCRSSGISFGLETKRDARASDYREIAALAEEIVRVRDPGAEDRFHPLFLRCRELWLESEVRSHIQEIDAALLPAPVYGQVPAFASAERGVLDLLAVDSSGRLGILELKASEDIHLPLQVLDYYARVCFHLERGEFANAGYFRNVRLRPEPPRLHVVAPALEFHPANATVLRYFSPDIEIARIGVGADWKRQFQIVTRETNPWL